MEQRWSVLDRIARAKIIGQVRGHFDGAAFDSAAALVDGGIRVIEVMFTGPEAHRLIEKLDSEYEDVVLVGAGGLTNSNQIDRAVASGARFLTSPGCDPDLVSLMQQTNLMVTPGALTPSEIILAQAMGTDAVRLFPGSLLGTKYLQILRQAFPQTSIFATEEESLESVKEWFAVGATAVAAGDLLASAGEIEGHATIAARARKLVEAAREQ